MYLYLDCILSFLSRAVLSHYFKAESCYYQIKYYSVHVLLKAHFMSYHSEGRIFYITQFNYKTGNGALLI